MSTLHINLPPDLQARLQMRASESGYATVEQYAQAVLAAELEASLLDEATERLLLERLKDAAPGIELTPAFKDDFREQVRQRRLSGGAER